MPYVSLSVQSLAEVGRCVTTTNTSLVADLKLVRKARLIALRIQYLCSKWLLGHSLSGMVRWDFAFEMIRLQVTYGMVRSWVTYEMAMLDVAHELLTVRIDLALKMSLVVQQWMDRSIQQTDNFFERLQRQHLLFL